MFASLRVRRCRLIRRRLTANRRVIAAKRRKRTAKWKLLDLIAQRAANAPYRDYLHWPKPEARQFLAIWGEQRRDVYTLIGALVGVLMRSIDPENECLCFEAEDKCERSWKCDQLKEMEPLMGVRMADVLYRPGRPLHSNEVFTVYGMLMGEKLRQFGNYPHACEFATNMWRLQCKLIL